MTSRDFCYWLQGYLEIEKEGHAGPSELSPEQVSCIAKHLALVFRHEIDPSAGDEKMQEALNKIHGKPGADPNHIVYRC